VTVRVAALTLLVACSGPDDDSTTHSGTGPTPTPTDFDGFKAFSFGVTAAEFAVRPDGAIGGWIDADGDNVPATLVLTLADPTYASSGPTADNACTFTWTWSDPIPAESGPATKAFGRWNPSEAPAARLTETCSALEFPERWRGDPAGAVGAWSFGAGIGPLDAGVREAVRESFGDQYDELIPYVAGGGFWWDGLREVEEAGFDRDWRSGFVDTGVVYGWALDASGQEVLAGGAPVSLLQSEMVVDGEPQPGRYQLQGTTLLTPATALIP
jgi:hypothetical protein